MYHEYIDVQVGAGATLPPQAFIGNGPPYMVGRLSYAFGLTGPCVSTDTACSSSLVATHLAHRALLNAESHAAVAGGINIMLLDSTTAGICQLQAGFSLLCRPTWACSATACTSSKGCPAYFCWWPFQHQACETADTGAVHRGPLPLL